MIIKKITSPLIAIILLFGSANAQSRFWHDNDTAASFDCNHQNWRLVFEDQFDGSGVDEDKWRIIEYGYGKDVLYAELKARTPKTVEVSGGSLKLKLIRDTNTIKMNNGLSEDTIMSDGAKNLRTYTFSGGRLQSTKEIFRCGKYEIKCRFIDPIPGMWPAFWTHSGISQPKDNPMSRRWSELDVFEIYYERYGDSGKFVYSNNMHFDWNGDGITRNEQVSFRRYFYNYFTEWHVFTCYFMENEAYFYIDDRMVCSKFRYKRKWLGTPVRCGDRMPNNVSEVNGWPRNVMYLFLNMSMETHTYPYDDVSNMATYEIDYVKYWEAEK